MIELNKDDWIQIKQNQYRRLKKEDPKNANGYTARIGFKYFKKRIKVPDKFNCETEAHEYLDKHFPKGDKRRGEAMVLMALTFQSAEKILEDKYEKEN